MSNLIKYMSPSSEAPTLCQTKVDVETAHTSFILRILKSFQYLSCELIDGTGKTKNDKGSQEGNGNQRTGRGAAGSSRSQDPLTSLE